MRYLLALACLAACGGDPSYRGPNGEVVGLNWRCKEGSYTGSYLPSRGTRLVPCPFVVPILCPDPAGGTRKYFVVDILEDQPMPSGMDYCERIRRAGD